MKTKEGKEVYRRRTPVAETPFGYIKGVLGIRQFLVRGLDKVRTEWRWICTAYNLRKLLAMLQGASSSLQKVVAKRAQEDTTTSDS